MTRVPPFLVALTPGTLEGPRAAGALLDAARVAFAAGLPALLLREPLLDERSFVELARRLVELARGTGGAWVGVHDRAHAALAAGADGLHLGHRSLCPADARALVGDALAVGFSAHAHDGAADVVGADYLTFGPLHDTPSKRGLLEPVGFDGLRAAVARFDLPLFALGGVRPADLAPVLATGAAGVAVLSGILGARDVQGATRSYLAAAAAATP